MSKIKFVKISSLPVDYYRGFYDADPKLKSKSYGEQYRRIMDDCYSFADFWKTNLEKTGRYDALEILTNVEPLQKKWAEENKIKYSESSWAEEILLAQISAFTPDVVFTHDLSSDNPGKIRLEIKKQNPSVKTIIGWDGILALDADRFAGCDIMLSGDKETIDYYSKAGKSTYFFSFGFEKEILNKIVHRNPTCDVLFTGSLRMKGGYHLDRIKFLAEISKKTKLAVWIRLFPSLHRSFDKNWIYQLKKIPASQYFNALKVASLNRGGIFGLEMFQKIADSKITFNIHAKGSDAGNVRMFEATGIGSCLLTDDLEGNKNYFEPDKEIVTYKSIPEAIEKIKYLLSHEEERKKIAAAGQKKTLEEHSLYKKISDFAIFLEKNL